MVHTNYSQQQLADALVQAMTEAKLLPTQSSGAILLAQIDAETANGGALWNNNAGNITTADQSRDFWQPSTGPASKLKFLVYPTLADGMRGYIGFLKARPKMLDAAASGNVHTFSERIRADGYNPAAEVEATTKLIGDIAKDKAKYFAQLPPGPGLTSTPATGTTTKPSNIGKVLLGALVLAFGGFVFWKWRH